ncbi:unnamed protein product [Didymodactylos carnosus]|uniref:Uncharacterized protein n=1 Tax=Didymodactylos carnosus TaxID=1234261 RepID=A0A8S2HN94_9BILA|nr:unnamed protein product [Didymodactylos carnosus]CAF3664626.1 unnamed protein product [Didymodactylos carnosus]
MKMNCNELYEIEYESNQKNAEEVDDDVVGEKTKKVQNEYPPPLAESMIVKKINLMTLDGKTPTRFMLNVARVMLESDQFTNGYLPDFKGEKLSRIPIDED